MFIRFLRMVSGRIEDNQFKRIIKSPRICMPSLQQQQSRILWPGVMGSQLRLR
jgi:hypothetical protein